MNKKKLAVLVGGELRQFEYSHKSWTFLNEIDYDIFFSTWNTSYECSSSIGIIINETKTREDILKYFPNAYIIMKTDNFINNNVNKMLYHWKTLFKMSNELGEYDYVLLIRPDIVIKEKQKLSEFIKNINEDYVFSLGPICYIPSIVPAHVGRSERHRSCISLLGGLSTTELEPNYFIADSLFIGKYMFLKKIFENLLIPYTNEHHMCYHLAKYFITNDIYAEDIHKGLNIIDWFVMRSIHRYFLDFDFEIQLLIYKEWVNFNSVDELKKYIEEKQHFL